MRPYRKKRELADWIRRRLGAPFIKVMVDSTQIDDCIDQACDFFGEFAGGVGNVDSVILINPELVYYDGTGKESQPGPKKGKWRKPLPPFLMDLTIDEINSLTVDQYEALKANCGTVYTTGGSGSSCCPSTYNSTKDQYGGDDGNPKTNYQIDSDCCPETSEGPGPGWCGDGIQPAHCYTETDPGDPLAVGPYWVEGDTTAKPSIPNRYLFKTVYPVPSDVIAVHERLMMGMFGVAGNSEDNALFSPMAMMMNAGGSWGMQSAGKSVDNRWGFWMGGGGGGFVDIVGLQMGLQYLEMFRQMFTVKMHVQLNELDHTVTLSPPPTTKGIIAVACTRKVADESMYSHQWVRQYALAKTMQDIGMNSGKYTGLTMPGGASINFELFLTRGDALVEKLEKQLTETHDFVLPVDFFVG